MCISLTFYLLLIYYPNWSWALDSMLSAGSDMDGCNEKWLEWYKGSWTNNLFDRLTYVNHTLSPIRTVGAWHIFYLSYAFGFSFTTNEFPQILTYTGLVSTVEQYDTHRSLAFYIFRNFRNLARQVICIEKYSAEAISGKILNNFLLTSRDRW